MHKKKSFTILERATILVPEFQGVIKRLSDQVAIRGQSSSTIRYLSYLSNAFLIK